MQDIDFDEIDRAVSSVTTPPKAAVSVSEPVAVTTPPSTPQPPAVRRSTGRFMDVVHPSSDMRSSSVSERSTPRQEQAAEVPERTNEYPDPLDFHGFTGDELSDKPSEVPAPEAQAAPTQEDAVADVSSLESPFLSNAKVEKRPLGGFSSDEPAPQTPSPSLSTPEAQPLLESPEPEPSLEAVNAFESEPGTNSSQEAEPEPTPAPVAIEEPTGPTSITQQYKEHPRTTEQPSSAIYDSEATHRSLNQGTKKKSSALVIVWILLLILVGGGIGAAVYFFVLPMLSA